ncbi:MAG TPA: DUF1116 domain-containing protein [bacterium]|nr:MAG: hypothetical protein HeimC3_51690 [Candidatus Heimdallarchaeota archaeon LC_3]HEC65836.1 DUF1116 domain-containing protein [bacterium]
MRDKVYNITLEKNYRQNKGDLIMTGSMGSQIEEANKEAVKRILSAECNLVDIDYAGKVVPGFKSDMFTHAGPPIEWERMCRTQKYAITNLIRYEGLADTTEKAERLAETREVIIEPNHNHDSVSGMCGATSASLPVLVVKNKVHDNTSHCLQQTSLTAFGNKYETTDELDFVRNILAPVLKATINEAGGINLKEILATGIQMGDELHGKLDACRNVFASGLLPYIVKTDFPKDVLAQVGEYFNSHQGRWYGGNLMMASCKAMMDPAKDIKHSTIVTAMARNGVEFGIQVSGLGSKWFTGPAGKIIGFTFPGYRPEDSTLDLGDSAISEARGFGATAAPAAPGHARFIGRNFKDAIDHTKQMKEISQTEDPLFQIPYLDFVGIPVGIDIRKVVETGILPIVNTGMAHKEGGHPMIGGGRADAPMECFKGALIEFVEKYG